MDKKKATNEKQTIVTVVKGETAKAKIPKERLRSVPHATLSIDAKLGKNR